MFLFRGFLAAAILACTGATVPLGVPEPARALTVTESFLPDTLSYKFSWTAGANATGYQVNLYPVAGNVAGWVTSPVSPVSVAGTNVSVKAINGGQWDSVRFRVVVRSTRGAVLSKDSSFSEWWVRKLGAPGPVIVDSSLVVIGMRAIKIPLDSTTLAVCPVVRFGKGGEAIPAKFSGGACGGVAIALVTSPKQQAIADTLTLSITHTDRRGHSIDTLKT